MDAVRQKRHEIAQFKLWEEKDLEKKRFNELQDEIAMCSIIGHRMAI